MRGRTRVDVWFERVVLAGFVATMVAEWQSLRGRDLRQPGDLDDATPAQLSSNAPPADPLIPVGYERDDTIASLSMLVGMLVMSQVVWGPFNRRTDEFLYRHRIFKRSETRSRRSGGLGRVRQGGVWIAAMLAWDFLYYWEHRFMHEVRLLWAHHVSHHSSERYNLSTALRQPWSNILTHWVFAPMAVVGFRPAMTERARNLNLVYQYWIHTEVVDKLPPAAEQVLNTASHHRVHHGVNPQYLDKNYGGILIVWDKLFGTFEPEFRRVKYGITKNIDSFNPLVIAYHEFAAIIGDVRRDRRWRDRLGHVFGHPGWSPPAPLATAERSLSDVA